jgi:hypothetical protein
LSARKVMALANSHDINLVADPKTRRIVAYPKTNLTDQIRTAITENKEALLEYLLWDQEEAYALMRRAWAYVAEQKTEFDKRQAEKMARLHGKRSKAIELEADWTERLLDGSNLPEEITPEEFVADELYIGSGVRYRETLVRWEEIGGDAKTLRAAIESGTCGARFGKEGEDFGKTYLYPDKVKNVTNPKLPMDLGLYEEEISQAFTKEDMGAYRVAIKAWVVCWLEDIGLVKKAAGASRRRQAA